MRRRLVGVIWMAATGCGGLPFLGGAADLAVDGSTADASVEASAGEDVEAGADVGSDAASVVDSSTGADAFEAGLVDAGMGDGPLEATGEAGDAGGDVASGTIGWADACAPCERTTAECPPPWYGFICPLACWDPPPSTASGCYLDAHVDAGVDYWCCPPGNPGEF